MPRVLFWNAEGISEHAVRIAERAARSKERLTKAATASIQRHANQGATKAITRAMVQEARHKSFKHHGLDKNTRREAAAMFTASQFEQKATQYRNKYQFSQDLPFSAPHVFFCEVVSINVAAQSPLQAGALHATKCYAHYVHGAPSPFTHCPVTIPAGWYAGPAIAANHRVPKSVTLAGAGAPVRFCFWHGPSGNNGAVVAAMYAALNAGGGGAPFVLFGDLNADPAQVAGQGVPLANIIRPPAMTRISGRILDYAVSNVPHRFTLRPLLPHVLGYDIKVRTGSDHMPMILDFH